VQQNLTDWDVADLARTAEGRPAPTRSRHLRLRAVDPADHPLLYQWENHPEVRGLLGYREPAPSLGIFQERMRLDPTRQLVATRPDGTPVVWLSLYNRNAADGYAWLSVVADPGTRSTGLGIEAAALFLTQLFLTTAMRKIYADSYDNALRQYRSGIDRYFRVEARLREHIFLDGRYRDRFTIAVYRDEWLKKAGRIARALRFEPWTEG